MDERAFDNLVRELAASAQSRRTLALTGAGLMLSMVAPLASDTDAARRRQARRKKNRKSGKGKQGGSGKGQHGGHQGDCGQPDACPRDPATGIPGTVCADGFCSCAGSCCQKGYACFVTVDQSEEVCCFDDAGAVEIPDGVPFAVCPGATEPRDTCCKANECKDGECRSFTPGRYRRNPR